MKNVFSYDSKLMQALMFLGDICLLNLVYVLCCLPVITIGAAQAGLHTGIRVLVDPNDDRSPVRAFFRGFRSGFWCITRVFCLVGIGIVLSLYGLILVLVFQSAGEHAPVWMSAFALFLFAMIQSVASYFHANFQCSTGQLLKNTFLFLMANLPRCLVLTVLIWFPLVVFLLSPLLFLQFGILFICMYYGMAALAAYYILKKPTDRLRTRMQEVLDGQKKSEDL